MEEKKTTQEIQGEINAYKQLLQSTDHLAIQHSEGEIPDSEYESIRLQRRGYREQIRALEEMLR